MQVETLFYRVLFLSDEVAHIDNVGVQGFYFYGC